MQSTKPSGTCVGELSFFFGVRQTTNARTPQHSSSQLFVLGMNSYQVAPAPSLPCHCFITGMRGLPCDRCLPPSSVPGQGGSPAPVR